MSGSQAGRVQDLELLPGGEAVLGRDPESSVVFRPEDGLVSRRHATLRQEDGILLLRDLDSTAGTFLDGVDVEEAELRKGDVFELGRGGPRLRLEESDGGTIVVSAPDVLPSALAAEALPVRAHAASPVGPGSRLRLTFASGTRQGDVLTLAGSVVRIGRGQGSAVWTPDDAMVSAQHAKVVRLEQGYVLIDLESRNGTYLNGHRVERSALSPGDVIGLGAGGPELLVDLVAGAVGEETSSTIVIPNFAELVRRAAVALPVRDVVLESESVVLGRDAETDLFLDSPIVSRRHARLSRRGREVHAEDLGSANGTYIDGRRIESEIVLPGARLVVGPFEIVVEDRGEAAPLLRVLDTRRRTRIDARGLVVEAGGKAILQDVSLSVGPGSFVALIGPSGAGKSTLLSALSGARPATGGDVRVNGRDLYQSFSALKATIGYVPQDDIVHGELTVAESLLYTARLRLPADTTDAERARRVTEVLATLELTERRDTPIHRLSGGQRKRVSIATELLTEPNLLFLDEPTSGLDPGLEESLMLLLRELSYKGKTVVLVTHTLDNIHLCDAVGLMVDGRLAFFGSAQEARTYFGIDHMVNLYGRLKERRAEDWQQRFRAHPIYETRVARALAAMPAVTSASSSPGPTVPIRERSGPGALRQFGILSSRYWATLTRDTRNAVLLVAQAPLIAGVIGLSLLYGQGDIAYTKPKNTILFLLALTSVWFGCSNAVRELVKERAIYLRERMVNLRSVPYVASKVLVLGALALVQCVLFLVILDRWFGIPGRFPLLLLAMLLASLVGILLGLTLSALSGTADRAMTLLPLLLIPQVVFTSPSVQMDMKGPAGLVARAMPTWWGFDLLRRVALEPDDTASDDELERRLGERELVLMTKARFTEMLQAGYSMFEYRSAIETTWVASLPESLGARLPMRLGRWRPAAADASVLILLAGGLFGAAVGLQRRHDRR